MDSTEIFKLVTTMKARSRTDSAQYIFFTECVEFDILNNRNAYLVKRYQLTQGALETLLLDWTYNHPTVLCWINLNTHPGVQQLMAIIKRVELVEMRG